MDKKRALWIPAVIAAILAVVAVAGILLLPKSGANEPDPAPRGPDGYIVANAQYLGFDRMQLNGQPIATDPTVDIKQYLLPPDNGPLALTGGQRHPLNELFKDVRPVAPITVHAATLTAMQRRLSIEQRAIIDTRARIAARQPVNVLPGTLYTPYAPDYNGLQAGAIDESQKSFDMLESPIVYFESDGTHTAAVLVTVNHTDLDYVSTVKNGVRNPYGTSGKGTSYVTPAKGQFLTTLDRQQVWTARQFSSPCAPANVSSACLYKLPQQQVAFRGADQAIVVTPVNTYEYNTQASTSGDRSIGTMFTMPTNTGRQVPLGIEGGQYIYPQMHSTIQKMSKYLFDNKGRVFAGPDLVNLPAFAG